MTIADANSGGLLATLESLPAFIPYSHVPKSGKMTAAVRRCPKTSKPYISSAVVVISHLHMPKSGKVTAAVSHAKALEPQ